MKEEKTVFMVTHRFSKFAYPRVNVEVIFGTIHRLYANTFERC